MHMTAVLADIPTHILFSLLKYQLMSLVSIPAKKKHELIDVSGKIGRHVAMIERTTEQWRLSPKIFSYEKGETNDEHRAMKKLENFGPDEENSVSRT
ncbi:Hypothetical predicted protein [Octopus vulgaris]|uniref:Uncharacterized protein n=1 Tax=Octopus vulgaris TaxID=6645 RepID=A0AA36AP69_OCTVU|nr:Hypothetical predicted protein [Octopus vulgaris]